ncbi:MAG: thiol peroxidase [Desulfobacterium sp.]|nr:thiol peroxidase [Desulfobacterium sp.]MBU3948536.1 thiol peroxidase [Pseudomonadota bacterium]MBU4009752.1 thiol peroxidase [Pseudomonadota bacterium]MBU4036100.1 thiol peroxidase [Pseudomonadota bacterium]
MKRQIINFVVGVTLLVLFFSCAKKQADMPIDTVSVSPGSQVKMKGEPLSLIGNAIEVGKQLPDTSLVDAKTMNSVNLNDYKGAVLFLSIVPSIDTKVCEAQTHYLGEQGDKLPSTVKRITISRDTPFAQVRFAEEAKLNDIQYLSDYKEGSFGRSIGLLIDGPMLLARSVILVDKQGIVQYIQVVPEITHLPDMEKAFEKAAELDKVILVP